MERNRAAQEIGTTITVSSYDLERMERYNSREGDLDGYDCPLCHNKGNHMTFRDGYEILMECECMQKRRWKWQLQKSGLAELAEQYRFDTFRTENELQQTMKTLAEEFAEQGSGWFFIGGQVGCGKTHLCTAIANALLEQGKEIRYLVWTEEVGKLKALRMEEAAYARALAAWKQAEVLFIDDLFKTRSGGMPTDADVQIAFELLNARYNDPKKITLLSGERELREIMDIDEALGSRIYQRCGKFKLSVGRERRNNYRLRQT